MCMIWLTFLISFSLLSSPHSGSVEFHQTRKEHVSESFFVVESLNTLCYIWMSFILLPVHQYRVTFKTAVLIHSVMNTNEPTCLAVLIHSVMNTNEPTLPPSTHERLKNSLWSSYTNLICKSAAGTVLASRVRVKCYCYGTKLYWQLR